MADILPVVSELSKCRYIGGMLLRMWLFPMEFQLLCHLIYLNGCRRNRRKQKSSRKSQGRGKRSAARQNIPQSLRNIYERRMRPFLYIIQQALPFETACFLLDFFTTLLWPEGGGTCSLRIMLQALQEILWILPVILPFQVGKHTNPYSCRAAPANY